MSKRKEVELSGLIAELEMLRINNPDAKIKVAIVNVVTKTELHVLHLINDEIEVSSFDINMGDPPKNSA